MQVFLDTFGKKNTDHADAAFGCICVICGFFQIKPKIIAKTSLAGFVDFVLPSNRFTFNIDTGQPAKLAEVTNVEYYIYGNHSLYGCFPRNSGMDSPAKKREG